MFSRFFRDHIFPVMASAAGMALVVLSFLSDVHQLSSAGMALPIFTTVGAATFAISIVWLIYRVHRSSLSVVAGSVDSSETRADFGGRIAPDVTLFEAVHWRVRGSWLPSGEPRYVLPREEYNAGVNDLLEKSRNSQLTIWGRPDSLSWSKSASASSARGKLEVIAPDYLKFSELIVPSRNAAVTRSLFQAELSPANYSDLMTSSREVMSLWPRRPIG
jgi:hypothetical protein